MAEDNPTGERFFAHGKVILLGEHAVVYGTPALGGTLSLGATVSLEPGSGRLVVPAWQMVVSSDYDGNELPLARAYRAIRRALGLSPSGFDLKLEFSLPAGAGLGSSAAFAVAIGRALIRAHALPGGEALVAAAALASENEIHGKSSGFDQALALSPSGFYLFSHAAGCLRLTQRAPLSLVIADSGRTRDTRSAVDQVASLLRDRSDEVRARIAAIAVIVDKGRAALEARAYGELGAAMQENQRHLSALEVSAPEIDQLCALANDQGAIGAKLTGGGRGGCVIMLAPGREQALQRAVENSGFRAFVAEVGG